MRFITYQTGSGPRLGVIGPAEPAVVLAPEVKLPDRPTFFTKATTSVIGPGAGIPLHATTPADLTFDIPATLEWLSQGMTLLPGDIIATGTPAGVGFARTPPEFLKAGDRLSSEIQGVGLLENRVLDR